MHVSIDHEKLVFLHKHPDYRVVANLDFIANRAQHTSSGPLEGRPFEHLTLTELQGLFRNTTAGKDLPTGDKETLEELLLQLADFLPQTDCDPAEVERQAGYLENKFPKGMAGFSYVRGANTPGKCADLYKLTTEKDPVELLQGARQSVARKQLARQRYYNREGVQGVPAPAPSVRTGSSARNAGKPAARPRSGVCGLIHDALDARHKETDEIPTREWVKALAQEKGWNTSTAGVQYGAWRKQNNLP